MDNHSIDHISFKRIRPRIQIELQLTSEQVIETIQEHLSKPDVNCEGQAIPGFATI